MTGYIDCKGRPIKMNDVVYHDGYYTVKQRHNGEYYLESHHIHKTRTPFNEDVPLTRENEKLMTVLTRNEEGLSL